jgi:hypothetical protein
MRIILSLLDRPTRRVALALAIAAAVGTGGAGAAHADDDVPASLRPVAECVIVNGDGSFTAFFGYSNGSGQEIAVPVSSDNRIDERVGQPVVRFRTGRVVAAFSVTTMGSSITWRLGDQRIRVTAESTPCSTHPTVPEAPVALLLLLAPAGMTAWWMRRRQRLHSPC